MSYSSIHQYLNHVDRAIKSCEGYELAELVSIRNCHIQSPSILQYNGMETACQDVLDSPFDEMLAAHIRCACAVTNANYEEAFACQILVVQSFSKGFQAQKEENWGLPVLQEVVLDLRLLALKVESESIGKGRKEGEILEKAAEQIMSCFRICVADSRTAVENSKRWGTLGIVNQLFKIYFKLNKLPLCRPLIRAIESSDIKDDFTISHQVTYKYFVGCKAMFDSEFKTASDSLEFALAHCPSTSMKNRRLILTYLIPIKMMLGQVPQRELLEKYQLLQFHELALNVCSGNLLMFAKSLDKHQSFFIKAGIYLILEKLKTVAMRNLFKKVWLLMGKCHQLDLKAFEDALKFNEEEDIDSDEVECIIANLIDKNYIKGYISHQHQKLVVSKQNAFPLLSTIQKK